MTSRYISDSRMLFRGKDVFQFVKAVKHRPVQIPLHHLHFTENATGYDMIFLDGIQRTTQKTHDNFKVNEGYAKDVNGNLLELVWLRL